MVKIRLQRFGAHKNPQYRIVASDSRSPRDGKFIEILGSYNPIANPAKAQICFFPILYSLFFLSPQISFAL